MSVTGRYFIRIVILAAIFSIAYFIGRNAPASSDVVDDTPMRVFQGYAMELLCFSRCVLMMKNWLQMHPTKLWMKCSV